MKKFDLGPFSIECQKCGNKMLVKLSDFKACNTIKCKKCGQEHHITDDVFKKYQKSIRDLQKTISNTQKKINKAFK